MKNQIIIEAISECPYCGIESESISDRDAHALDTWLQDNYGETLEDAAREYEETGTGFTWEHGGGYDVTDSDLLGGTGSGERSNKAGDTFQFVYVDSDDKTGYACGECASYM